MEILFKIIIVILIASVILAIIVSKTLKKLPSIKLVQRKLSDKESSDNIEEAVKYLKIVNKK